MVWLICCKGVQMFIKVVFDCGSIVRAMLFEHGFDFCAEVIEGGAKRHMENLPCIKLIEQRGQTVIRQGVAGGYFVQDSRDMIGFAIRFVAVTGKVKHLSEQCWFDDCHHT